MARTVGVGDGIVGAMTVKSTVAGSETERFQMNI